MKTKEKMNECCQNIEHCKCHGHGGNCGGVYGIGVVGALFYFLQGATTFGLVMTGIGKALFWPAFVVFKVLGMLGI